MESTHLFRNLSTTVNETFSKHSLDLCFPYSNVYFGTVGSTVPYAVNTSLNVPLAIVATLANILVFSAVRRSPSIRLPSKLLLCSLVLTDIGVGLVVQPLFVTFLVTKVNDSLASSCLFIKSSGFAGAMLSAVSLWTMAAISLDRYIALFFHFKHHEIVTTRRVYVLLASIWSYAGFYASTWLWKPILFYPLALLNIAVCFLVISVAYIKIYRGLRHQHGHQVQVQAQEQAGNTLDLAKYRRSASSMLWIYGLFILCYLPFLCATFVIAFLTHNAFIGCIEEFTVTIVFLNSCLNPFVYCFRLPEIRAGVLQTLRNIGGQSAQQ